MTDVINRRSFLRASAVAGATATSTSVLGLAATMPVSRAVARIRGSFPVESGHDRGAAGGHDLGGDLCPRTHARLPRADRGDRLERTSDQLDHRGQPRRRVDRLRLGRRARSRQRTGTAARHPHRPKNVLATADHMETTAGSLALVGSTVPRDAGAVAKLRDGERSSWARPTSEWNAFRGWPLHGGWSARAGMGLNPMRSTTARAIRAPVPAAVAANLAAGAVGLETYGSIVMPSSLCGLVGLKPTSGLVSRSGTIPISSPGM